MTAVMGTLDGVIAGDRGRCAVAAVLDAADRARDQLHDAQFVASFAPPITKYASCVCGATMEVRGELTDDDYRAFDEFDDMHAYCEADA